MHGMGIHQNQIRSHSSGQLRSQSRGPNPLDADAVPGARSTAAALKIAMTAARKGLIVPQSSPLLCPRDVLVSPAETNPLPAHSISKPGAQENSPRVRASHASAVTGRPPRGSERPARDQSDGRDRRRPSPLLGGPKSHETWGPHRSTVAVVRATQLDTGGVPCALDQASFTSAGMGPRSATRSPALFAHRRSSALLADGGCGGEG
jgi:hypothetical protein